MLKFQEQEVRRQYNKYSMDLQANHNLDNESRTIHYCCTLSFSRSSTEFDSTTVTIIGNNLRTTQNTLLNQASSRSKSSN